MICKLLLVVTSLVALSAAGQTEKTTLSENKLRGQVKKVVTTANWQTQKFGEWENNGLYYAEEWEFNKQGLLTRSTRQEDIDYGKEYTFKYDGNKNLIRKKNIYGPKKEKKESNYLFSYENNLNTVLDMTDGGDKLFWREKMKYNDKGLLKEKSTYDDDGDLIHKNEYSYNEAGQQINYTQRNSKRETIKSIETLYQSGNPVKEITIEKQRVTTTKTVEWTWRDGYMFKEQTTIESDKPTRKSVKEFDQWGNLVREASSTGTEYKFSYKFDSNNNWISMLCTFKGFDGPSAYRVDRLISYY